MDKQGQLHSEVVQRVPFAKPTATDTTKDATTDAALLKSQLQSRSTQSNGRQNLQSTSPKKRKSDIDLLSSSADSPLHKEPIPLPFQPTVDLSTADSSQVETTRSITMEQKDPTSNVVTAVDEILIASVEEVVGASCDDDPKVVDDYTSKVVTESASSPVVFVLTVCFSDFLFILRVLNVYFLVVASCVGVYHYFLVDPTETTESDRWVGLYLMIGCSYVAWLEIIKLQEWDMLAGEGEVDLPWMSFSGFRVFYQMR